MVATIRMLGGRKKKFLLLFWQQGTMVSRRTLWGPRWKEKLFYFSEVTRDARCIQKDVKGTEKDAKNIG